MSILVPAPKIENIVFDLGRVLIHYTMDHYLEFLRVRGAEFTDLADLAQQVGMRDFELGLVSSDVFFQRNLALLDEGATHEELAHWWMNMFTPMDDMLALAKQLKNDYRIFILSNINELHWDHLRHTYELHTVAHGFLGSCDVGLMKPDEKIFREAEKRFDLIPSKTVFVDDLKENADGARSAGWYAVHFESAEKTKRELEKLGVKVSE